MNEHRSFWDYFWFAKFFLRTAGIFPIGGRTALWKSILAEILLLSPILYGLYVTIPWIIYILFRSHDMDDLLEAMIIVITIFGGQFRAAFIFVHRRKIVRLFAACEILWDHADPQDYKVIFIWARQARLFSTAYFCAAQFAITTFVLTATVKQLSSPANSTIRYYPFRLQEDSTPSPQYEISYILQVIIGYVGSSYIVAADMSGTLLILNMCGQLALIRSWLLDLSRTGFSTIEEISNEDLKSALKKCIHRHQIILDCCRELEEVVCYINLAQMTAGMYNMAISCARLIGSMEATRYFGPLLSSISGLFFSCWPANNLSFISSEVAQVVYGVPWYLCSPRERTAVHIMLMRSQRSVQLTAGKFVAMSLETFCSILSSSISFCMVLNRF